MLGIASWPLMNDTFLHTANLDFLAGTGPCHPPNHSTHPHTHVHPNPPTYTCCPTNRREN